MSYASARDDASDTIVRGKSGNDVADDGQEEVFSREAVERGIVEDPKALSPGQVAQKPKTPGPIDQTR